MPKLSPCSEGAHSTSASGELGELARLGDLAERIDAAVVEHHVRDLVRGGADERERRRDLLAQRLERAQEDGQALAFDGLADETGSAADAVGLASLRGQPSQLLESARPEMHPVGHDPVAPAVEAPRGPGGGLGDGDPHVQVVHPPPWRRAAFAIPFVSAFSE